ncbi:MAG: hypothetical protein IPM79_39245 [Polyangiaceae bacterium]|jgi:hypothetical protein|nr:hypothetical protein [Polyangiaceae bacterium]
MEVFLVQHEHEVSDEVAEVKVIGIYSSEELARQAIERLSQKPGFSSHLSGFTVGRYPVDRDHWSEGFESSPVMPQQGGGAGSS